MENKIFYAISERYDDDMGSTHLQVFKDSLENSINITSTVNAASPNVFHFNLGLAESASR